MLNKKILFSIVAFSMLPMLSANAAVMDEDDANTMYFKLAYQGSYVGSQKIDGAKKGTDKTTTIETTAAKYKQDYKPNFLGGAVGVGKYLSPELRAELEVAANGDFSLDKNATDGVAYFGYPDATDTKKGLGGIFANKGFNVGLASVNLYYDVNSGNSNFEPYVGAGAGIARVNFMSDPTAENITYPFAIQLSAGVKVALSNFAPIYLGYKLVYLPATEASEITKSNKTPETISVKMKTSYVLHNLDVGIIMPV